MADDTYPPDQDEDDDGLDEAKVKDLPRKADLSKRAGVKDQLKDLFDAVLEGFTDQGQRSDDIQDYWDIYNCRLTGMQKYDGNSQIFVPIVHNAVNARKTRFVNQMFPRSGRNVEVTSADGSQPYAEMALLEYYITKAKLRTQVMPALMVNGDVEGQYNLLVEWCSQERHVTYKTWDTPEMEPGMENPAAGKIETIVEEKLETAWPEVEVISDCDILILPETAASVEEAISVGGSVTVIRRWTKAKIQQMARDGHIRKDASKALIGQLADYDPKNSQKKKHLEAAGVQSNGTLKFALVYQTWGVLEIAGQRRLCLSFYGGEDTVLGCRRNPLWSDKVPLVSVPVDKISGSFKGISKVRAVADMQYFANDAINEAADSAAYSLLPIVMTDPEKNPRIGSMVMSLAAVWETSPKDTQFAQFPELWKDGFAMVAAAKTEVAQTLSVSPAAITGGGGSGKGKPNQAEVAQEQQVDLLTTADAVTVVEQGVLSPMLELFVEMDHQYRDKDIMVKQFGRMGLEATMESVPPIQFGTRYEYRWFGVEQARSAQQIQQQIAGMNVIRGIPPEQLGGYKVNLVPIITQLVENTFGPRLAPLVFQSPEQQMPVPVEQENTLLLAGYEVPTHELDDDVQHIQQHTMLLQEREGAPAIPNKKKILAHIFAHAQQMQKKQQAQMATQGAPGVPGGAIGPQPEPGVAGTPRIGAQPGQPRPQGPPGLIHQDQLHDPAVAPRL